MHFGLIAHRLHRSGTDCALLQWARLCGPTLQALGLQLHATGGAYEALTAQQLLGAQLHSVGDGRSGGLMRLVSRAAGGLNPQQALDGVIFFIDPVDPTSLYPEALALKRQCVIHGKPFVATLAGAIEWLAVEALHAGLPTTPPPAVPAVPAPVQAPLPALFDIASKTVALVAHDALKDQMVAFASDHFDTLSCFQSRVATGTTGGLLNALAWSRGWPADTPWVRRFQSGPLGGDAQIAELILDGHCHKLIFFEDPHVARQHEADIQLLDRAVYSAGASTTCFNTPAMATRWAQAMDRCATL
jgi:methylglyoxal synthase